MLNKCLTLFLLFTWIQFSTAYTQSTNTFKDKSKRNSQIDKRNSEMQIKQLKDGTLLVRLRTKQPLIKALLDRNRLEDVARIKKQLLAENIEIIRSFKSYFDFCPTYFFYSDHSEHVLKMEFDSVGFFK